MASGRPDYTQGSLSQNSVYGYTPEILFATEGLALDAGDSGTFTSYTVPAGYYLTVQGFQVTCNYPGLIQAYIGKIDGEYLRMYFDSLYALFHEKGILDVFVAGDELSIGVVNSLTDDVVLYASYYGLLEYVG